MEQLEIKSQLAEIVKNQKNKMHHIALDIQLHNGNILLKSFRLYDFDKKADIIKGMTMYEEYAYLREGRKPIFAYFKVTEIIQLNLSNSNYLFLSKPMNTFI